MSTLCDDCPPVGYPTEKTRCLLCPRRKASSMMPSMHNEVADTHERMERRFFLLWGWGRCATSYLDTLHAEQEMLKKERPGKIWGILVHDDPWALTYQRNEFRIQRIKHAFRSYGMCGCVTIDEKGYHKFSAEQLHARNCEDLQRYYRLRAHWAKRKLEELGPDNEMVRQARERDEAERAAEMGY